MPALAIAAALRELSPSVEPVLVGARRGVEAQILPTRDFRYTLLPLEPIYRRTWWKNARWPLVAWRVFRQLSHLFRNERPDAVLGTGGYASGPVVWWAARHGIPTAIQEQNAYPGLTTRRLARHARHIYLGLPEAAARLSAGSGAMIFDTGNPITPPAPARRGAALARFGLDGSRPVVLVTGGSQGALAINRAVAHWLDGGAAGRVSVIWVTGRKTHAEFAAYHRPPAVTVIDFLDPMADAYAVADLVVSRAGMITVAEVCAWGLPSVLVPLPTAAADHQTYNARAMAEAGAAVMVAQNGASADQLAGVLDGLLENPDRRTAMAARALGRGRPDAARDIVSHLLTLAGETRPFANRDKILG
jgi:UDP-N-acetylglucosamine--N-acetylmuramyl-(pentapeptide) pyrophosphoryl-undecaprenol N-acetylglucosamine transferase